jgi:hypothetical protein
MPAKKSTSTDKWVDPDEAPSLNRDWFERAEISEGGKLIRRRRPKDAGDPRPPGDRSR